MQTCKGKTRTGAACRAPAGLGGLCFFHANPDSARVLGQIGGRKNRSSVVDLQVPDNMTAADVRNVTAQAIRLLLSGSLHALEASALAQLCNSLYRVIPTADLETRVTLLEEQVVRAESAISPDIDPVWSPADRTETAKAGRLEVEQPTPRSIEDDTSARRHHEDGAESTSDGSGEAEEA